MERPDYILLAPADPDSFKEVTTLMQEKVKSHFFITLNTHINRYMISLTQKFTNLIDSTDLPRETVLHGKTNLHSLFKTSIIKNLFKLLHQEYFACLFLLCCNLWLFPHLLLLLIRFSLKLQISLFLLIKTSEFNTACIFKLIPPNLKQLFYVFFLEISAQLFYV